MGKRMLWAIIRQFICINAGTAPWGTSLGGWGVLDQVERHMREAEATMTASVYENYEKRLQKSPALKHDAKCRLCWGKIVSLLSNEGKRHLVHLREWPFLYLNEVIPHPTRLQAYEPWVEFVTDAFEVDDAVATYFTWKIDRREECLDSRMTDERLLRALLECVFLIRNISLSYTYCPKMTVMRLSGSLSTCLTLSKQKREWESKYFSGN